MQAYPKRLIEVDLPIKRISAHARREKSIRHGHISTLHIWWARRPLAACRAVVCASLWPDPADPLCPDSFRQTARQWMRRWANEYLGKLSAESYQRFIAIQRAPETLNANEEHPGHLMVPNPASSFATIAPLDQLYFSESNRCCSCRVARCAAR
jgi:putative DNA methylase